MEKKHLQNLNLAHPSGLRALGSMNQRCQKELNAMRASLQLAMSYSKLEKAQTEECRARKKKRNEMPDSGSESTT